MIALVVGVNAVIFGRLLARGREVEQAVGKEASWVYGPCVERTSGSARRVPSPNS